MVIDPRHDLGLGAVGQPHPTDDVQLPQLHRPRPLPALVISPSAAPWLWGDQPVADQAAVSRPRVPASTGSSWTPSRDARSATQRSWPRHAVASDAGTATAGTSDRPTRPARRLCMRAATRAPSAGRPVPARHIRHRRAVVQDFQHRLIALLHQPQLHQHHGLLRDKVKQHNHTRGGGNPPAQRTRECQPGAGATVAQDPGPRPERVSQLPEPRCQP